MNLKKVLTPDTVWVDLKADTKIGIIDEMIDRLVAAGQISDREAVRKVIFEREEKMSTGMQNGVAIPHGKTDAVNSLITAVGLNKAGVDFGAMDGLPSKIFVMTVSPVNRRGPHMQFLAEVSRILGQATHRKKLLAAKTHAEVFEILTGK